MRTKIKSVPSEGKDIELYGRILGKRDFGSIVFLDLRDDTGKIQLSLQEKTLGDMSQHKISNGDIVRVNGEIIKTDRGTTTLDVSSYTIYRSAEAELPDKRSGISKGRNHYDNRGLEILVSDTTFERFKKVNKIIAHIRQHFYERDYQEVDTGILQRTEDTSPSSTFITRSNGLGKELILRKSKEQRMKELIVGGFERIFEIGKSFRNEQVTRKYHPEINGLELYCAYSNWEGILELVEELLSGLNKQFGTPSTNPHQYKKIGFYDLIEEVFGVDGREAPLETIYSNISSKRRRNYGQNTTGRAFALMDLAGEALEEHSDENVVLMGIPKQVSVLSQSLSSEPTLAEEFRYFVRGTSFCYGNTELTDPNEQKERLREQGAYEGKSVDLDNNAFLKLMKLGIPPLGGLGIGLDRLLSIYTGSDSIKDVIYFPL